MPQQRQSRPASAKRRAFWFDPRFAIGLVLVVLSVAGVVAIVATSDSSITVMAARTAIAPGQRVSVHDLVATRVRVGRSDRLYLAPADVPADGMVVTRTIAAGELIPASAVGGIAGEQRTSVVLALTSRLPQSVGAGSRLDIWAAQAASNGMFDAPTVIVSSAVVVRLVEDSGILRSDTGSSVELLIPRSDVATVLESVANGAAVSAVPLDLPLGR
jgi:hypothetical protein